MIQLSDEARDELARLKDFVRPHAQEMILSMAARLHKMDRDEALATLSKESLILCAGIAEQADGELSSEMINGLVFGFCECVHDRLKELDGAQ